MKEYIYIFFHFYIFLEMTHTLKKQTTIHYFVIKETCFMEKIELISETELEATQNVV